MRTRTIWTAAFAALAFLFSTPQAYCLSAEFHTAKFNFEGKSIALDAADAGDGKPLVLLLHGASGPALPFYQQQAQLFADKGFSVLVPHYFDATRTTQATAENYRTWATLIDALIRHASESSAASPRKIFLVGYSLGASVALAAGSEGVPVTAIAEWYGSLPDDFFYAMKGMPPLLILHGQLDNNIPVGNARQLERLCAMKHLECESHIYADQGHGFGGHSLDDADERTLQFLSRYVASASAAH